MAGHGQSSVSTELRWEDVGCDIRAVGNLASGIWTREVELTNRPSWEELLEYGRGFYEYVAGKWGASETAATGTCLVATLCVAAVEYCVEGSYGYTLFQSTIPRGVWRDYMSANGQTEAPVWYRAAYSQPPTGAFKEALHAEDSVEFLANQKFPSFNDPGMIEEPRLIVYGKEPGPNGRIGQVNLCRIASAKNPTCQTVAKLLGIIFPPDQFSAEEMDIAERRAMRPAATLHPTTEQEYLRRTGNSGASGSRSAQSHTGGNDHSGGHGYHGSSRPQAPRSSSGSRHNDLASLTQGMSTLRVSSGASSSSSGHGKSLGPSSVSPAHSSGARAPPGSQPRLSTSKNRSSSRTSAPPPAPGGRKSTGNHR